MLPLFYRYLEYQEKKILDPKAQLDLNNEMIKYLQDINFKLTCENNHNILWLKDQNVEIRKQLKEEKKQKKNAKFEKYQPKNFKL